MAGPCDLFPAFSARGLLSHSLTHSAGSIPRKKKKREGGGGLDFHDSALKNGLSSSCEGEAERRRRERKPPPFSCYQKFKPANSQFLPKPPPSLRPFFSAGNPRGLICNGTPHWALQGTFHDGTWFNLQSIVVYQHQI